MFSSGCCRSKKTEFRLSVSAEQLLSSLEFAHTAFSRSRSRRVHSDVHHPLTLRFLLSTHLQAGPLTLFHNLTEPCHSLKLNDRKPTLPQTPTNFRMTTLSIPTPLPLNLMPNTIRMFSTHPYARLFRSCDRINALTAGRPSERVTSMMTTMEI